jgi:uncharacterized protein (DUF1684 family)
MSGRGGHALEIYTPLADSGILAGMARSLEWIAATLSSLLLLAPSADARDAAYVAEIQKWRENFDQDVRTGGWLEMIGRLKLDEGETTIGSDSASTMILPPPAPKRIGTVTREGVAFRFEPAAGVEATVDGEAASGVSELSTKPGSGRVKVGHYSFAVRAIGDDFYLLVRDSENPSIASFNGTSWFPIDSSYRVRARFTAYKQPEQVAEPLTHVDSKESMTSTGDVTFHWASKVIRLKTFIDEDQLFVMFQDPTNGRESYGGGRFLHAPLPKAGKTMLDFNKAFNPYCSINSYVMCPVPPSENRLDVRVAAGEKYDGHG